VTAAPRRLAIALLGLVVASGAAATSPARAHPQDAARGAASWTAGACDDDRGVTVVVDFTYFGGSVQVRCAAAPVGSGFEALTKAGFRVDQVASQPGLLCRIDGEPSGFHCQTAPPSNAYWAYWHAARGGSWAYSSSGASRTPPPGSVEGWAFGAQAQPGIAPPPPAPAPTTTTSPPPTGGTQSNPSSDAGPRASPPAPATTSAPGSPGSTTTTGATVDAEAPSVTSGARTAGGTRDGAADEEAAAPAAPASGSGGGSPVGVLVAGLAIGGVAVGAAVRTAVRRRGDLGEDAT
jgi:hypothetical protein